MTIQSKLIHLLSDGKFHSGEELGCALNLTRSGVWKIMKQLNHVGIEVNSVKGKGYQIPGGLTLLDKTHIYHHLQDDSKNNITRFEIVEKIASTNQHLLDELKFHPEGNAIVVAEYQSDGRGRRGRKWHSPYGKNIYLSLLWQFEKDPGELFGLSLVVALAVVAALEKFGIPNLQLKWPNDILWNGRKLSGILIEMIAKPHIETSVVIGIGINVNRQNTLQNFEKAWVDICEILSSTADRNRITAYVINELIHFLKLFEQKGFCHFLSDWQRYDILNNRHVNIYTANNQFEAKVLGVGNKGELIIQNEKNETIHLLQGEVSVRFNQNV